MSGAQAAFAQNSEGGQYDTIIPSGPPDIAAPLPDGSIRDLIGTQSAPTMPCFQGQGPPGQDGYAPCPVPGAGGADVPPPIISKDVMNGCAAKVQSANTTCTSSQGIGGQSAAAIQALANAQATQQIEEGAQAANGGVTVVNVTNNGQQQNPDAKAACNAVKTMALGNGVSDIVAGSFCKMAVSSCHTACDVIPSVQMPPALKGQCDNAMKMFAAQVVPQAMNAAIVANGGTACNAALTAANSQPPPLTAPPGMPNAAEPGNVGYQGNPAQSPAPGAFPPDNSGSGGSSLPTGGYPATADKNAQGAGTGGTQKSYDLGLAGGSTSGVPFANNGSGNMPGKSGEAPFDLASLFGKDKDAGNRGPASVNEITGATDLTNFQKVTRMMNKKRTALKSGDGA